MKSLKEELAFAMLKHESFRAKARAYILELGNVSNQRALMTITPANEKGMINGVTIPELVMLANLNSNTGEETILKTVDNGKNLMLIAKKAPRVPWELLDRHTVQQCAPERQKHRQGKGNFHSLLKPAVLSGRHSA